MRIFLSIALLLSGAVAMAQQAGGGHVPDRLLVQRRASASADQVAQALTRVGARVEKKISAIDVSAIRVPEAAMDRVSAALARTGMFTFVEQDHYAHAGQSSSIVPLDPNDPYFPSQWHLTQIQGPYAWRLTTGKPAVTIAVIDSGVDSTHPDLSSKLVAGWNFLTGTSNTADDLGHGTAVAGTAAADTNNALGVSGVAWNNMIMPLVVLNSSNYASYSDIASAITYAADHGVRVMNISIGGSSSSSTLQSAVNYAWSKGAVIFASAMNNSSSTPYYPAACSNVVSVSATAANDTFASFSNYGSWIDLSAPGNNILTTNRGGGYGYWYGTSFASPISAAVAALVLSVQPSLSNSALVTLLEQNSDDLGTPGWDPYFGYGQVNAYKAVLATQSTPADTTPPAVSIGSPANGATVSGTIQVQGTATDNVGVTSIQFYVDGSLAASVATSSLSFSWNTAAVPNGSHTLAVYAYDAAGNKGAASVSANVSNTTLPPPSSTPPAVNITQPANGSMVSGTVKISVSATSNNGIRQVSIYVDGVLMCTDTASPYTCTWNTRKTSSGQHTVTATAWDTAGYPAQATPVTVYK